MKNYFDTLKSFSNLGNLTFPHGSFKNTVSNALYGLNTLSTERIYSANRDKMGFVFFTRPQLNLTDININYISQLYNLKTTSPDAIQTFVRCTLDPRLMLSNGNYGKPIKSNLVNNQLCFIPILTNSCMSLSGWPDKVLPTFETSEGARGEVYSMADGSRDMFGVFDLDATFQNIQDSPVHMMFDAWTEYISEVFEGIIDPYIDYLVHREIDYNTRIYRIITDDTDRFVKQIYACGAAYPLQTSDSKFADYNTSSAYNMNNKEINIRFRCMGALYNDPKLLLEFNLAVAQFNPAVRNCILTGQEPYGINNQGLIKIPSYMKTLFNYHAIPFINLHIGELCWLVNVNDKVTANLIKDLEINFQE